MFLLFHLLTGNGLSVVLNLHSNMFLLFPNAFACAASTLYSHLHSNMFLLFLYFNGSRICHNEIYIPICFYYFQIAKIFTVFDFRFTFQYVSIISYADTAGR